jgi:rhodanese-related sulfurtransferase
MPSYRELLKRTKDEIVEVDAREARELKDALFVDVRERDEWEEGHIPGSRFAPYHDIHALPDGLDPERPVAVICASGQRAAVGASLVQRHGAPEVLHVVDGGVPSWGRNGWALERE